MIWSSVYQDASLPCAKVCKAYSCENARNFREIEPHPSRCSVLQALLGDTSGLDIIVPLNSESQLDTLEGRSLGVADFGT